MGTGGQTPKNKLHVKLADFLSRAVAALGGELGFKAGSFRNSDRSGVYLFRYGDSEFEIEIRLKS